jgi:hypothetical protein
VETAVVAAWLGFCVWGMSLRASPRILYTGPLAVVIGVTGWSWGYLSELFTGPTRAELVH